MPRASGRSAPAQVPLPLREAPLLMLMDGHALVHRAWHAIQKPLTLSSTGQEVRGAYGFASTFLKAIHDFAPTHCAIAFDLPEPTFRHNRFAAYKAHRPKAPPELSQQFPLVRRIVEAFRIPIYEAPGYEADDVLATLAAQARAQGLEVLILTGDTDTLQLVGPGVRVALHYRLQERTLFDEGKVRERYGGLSPAQLPHLKALIGDPTDNVPGVPGIGEKTATALLLQFGSIQGIYEHLAEVPPRLQALLAEHREQVVQGLDLTTLRADVPLRLDLEACRFWRYDRREVLECFRELEFVSLMPRVPQPAEASAPTVSATTPPPETALVGEYTVVSTAEALDALVQELIHAPSFTFDVETDSKDPMRASLVGLAFATGPGRAVYLPLGHTDGPNLSPDLALARLRPLLEDPQHPKIAHNANFDMTALAAHGVWVKGVVFDTLIAAHLLGYKALGLKDLCMQVLGAEMRRITALLGTGPKQGNMAQVPVAEAGPYACADADATFRLYQALEPRLRQEGFAHLFHEVEMPLVPVLVRMQVNGIALDVPLLREMSRRLGDDLKHLEEEIYRVVGHAFNINSSRQLGQVLFEELRVGRGKRTPTGAYSTEASVLEGLRGAHPVIDLVLKYRELAKLKSTYVDALPEMVNPRTGRIHTSYNQAGVITGRISSSEPNLQNIPIRSEIGRHIRRAFIPGERGWKLVGADYSQIELRVLAHLSRDPALMEAFFQGKDIHAFTASQVFGVPMEQVTPEQRRVAKVLNFGVIYGLSPFGVAQEIKSTPEEGARFIENYLGRYPGVRRYIEETLEKARRQGYVETLLGRRRAIPEINSPNRQTRAAAEREAINMPVQGTAAEIIKVAMIRLQERMDALKMRARMLLQVHDELVWEAPPEEIEPLKGIIQEIMPTALPLAVPLVVSITVGETWGEWE
ncbi:MAG: DNA polymerase I [Dehalococcoidia bacterium]|nr:DNA polymerase I [Dehalococcoidia bacterium]MDW8120070.1 DNA polymerase I [Chloroflexota bacterium]